jgi:hypothetical protein
VSTPEKSLCLCWKSKLCLLTTNSWKCYCNISVGLINRTTKNTGWSRSLRFEKFRNCPIRIEIITGIHIFIFLWSCFQLGWCVRLSALTAVTACQITLSKRCDNVTFSLFQRIITGSHIFILFLPRVGTICRIIYLER